MKKEKVITQLDKITEFSLYALIFAMPFSKSILEISFILAFVCWALKRFILRKEKISGLIDAFRPVRTDLNIPIAVFVYIGFLSTLGSFSFLTSLKGFFFKLFEWIMIYFLVVETINDKKKVKTMLGVILFSIALISTDGIFQFLTGTDFLRNYTMDTYNIVGNRVRASFGNPNSFAGWLLVMTSLVLSLTSSETKIGIKSILLIMTGLLMFCIVLTYSRGGWIGIILAIFFLCFFKSKRLLITVTVLVLILPFVIPGSVKKRIISAIEITEKAAIDRKILWREASNIIKDYPLIGCGFNTYATIGPHYRLDNSTGCYPHNSYLHLAAEMGLLGLGAFIWIMVALYKTSLANLKTINDRFHNAVLLGLLAGLSGFLLHSLVDTNIYALQLGNLMWFIMGLIVAVQRAALSTS